MYVCMYIFGATTVQYVDIFLAITHPPHLNLRPRRSRHLFSSPSPPLSCLHTSRIVLYYIPLALPIPNTRDARGEVSALASAASGRKGGGRRGISGRSTQSDTETLKRGKCETCRSRDSKVWINRVGLPEEERLCKM